MFRTLAGTARWALASVMTLSVASSLVGSGTYAAFVAQTTNPNNTFQAGTLKMLHSKDGQVLFAVQAFGGQPTLLASGYPIQVGSVTAQVAEGQQLLSGPDGGGLAPGSMLENTFTITRTGTLPYPIKLSVTGLENENDYVGSCDASNRDNIIGAADCGKGALSDALHVLVYYPVSDGYMCLWGDPNHTGMAVPADATNPTVPEAACGWGKLTENTPLASATGTISALDNGTNSLVAPLRTTATTPVVVKYATTASGTAMPVDVLPYSQYQTIHVRVHLDETATNVFQGGKTRVSLRWSSESGPVASGTYGNGNQGGLILTLYVSTVEAGGVLDNVHGSGFPATSTISFMLDSASGTVVPLASGYTAVGPSFGPVSLNIASNTATGTHSLFACQTASGTVCAPSQTFTVTAPVAATPTVVVSTASISASAGGPISISSGSGFDQSATIANASLVDASGTFIASLSGTITLSTGNIVATTVSLASSSQVNIGTYFVKITPNVGAAGTSNSIQVIS